MVRAVEKVRDRLLRASSALETANLNYAVVGGNAVAIWVATIDEAAVRNTQDVDVLIRRVDLDRAIVAMHAAGFVHRLTSGIHMFLDGPDAKARDAVHVVFASEKVRPDHSEAAPDLTDISHSSLNLLEQSDRIGAGFKVIALESLVRMKLTSFRDKDRTHLRDMLDVGLIDSTWVARFAPPLSDRLQLLIDSPEG